MGSIHASELETILRTAGDSTEPQLKVALGRLSVELKARREKGSTDSLSYFLSALRSLSKIRGQAHADSRMTCLWECGMYLYANDHGAEALDAVNQLNQLASLANSKMWLRKAANLGGIVYGDLGQVAESVTCYAKSLVLARDIQDLSGETAALLNMGGSLIYGGLYHEAIPVLSRAVQLSKSSPEGKRLGTAALANLALTYLNLEQFELGFKIIRECLEETAPPTDTDTLVSWVVREMNYVQLALELGKISLARTHAEACRKYAIQSGLVRSRIMADIAQGLCEIHGGDVEEGLGILEMALSAGSDISSLRVDILTALVKAYDLAGRPEPALKHLKDLLAYIRSSREKGISALLSTTSWEPSQKMIAPEDRDLRAFTTKEVELRAQVAEREVVHSRIEMLERLAVTADLKEEASGEHGYRVGKLSALLAEELNWSREACMAIDLAARVHDIGKIGVPDRILLTSKELQEAERHFMSTHTLIGAELLAKSNIPQLRMAEEIARFHHEWWNGQGYPSKLAGKRIPIHARIVALADVFDALTHGRPFAKPWPINKALQEIQSLRGSQFDPELTDLFLELIERLRVEHQNLNEYLGSASKTSPFLQARNKIRLMLSEERENEKKATVSGNETRH